MILHSALILLLFLSTYVLSAKVSIYNSQEFRYIGLRTHFPPPCRTAFLQSSQCQFFRNSLSSNLENSFYAILRMLQFFRNSLSSTLQNSVCVLLEISKFFRNFHVLSLSVTFGWMCTRLSATLINVHT